jgi:hypothetical protein
MALDFFVEALERVRAPDLTPVRPGEGAKGEHLLFGPAHQCSRLVEALGEHGFDVVPLGGGLFWRHLGEDGAKGRRDHLLVAFGDIRQQVAGEVHPAALMARPLEATPDG